MWGPQYHTAMLPWIMMPLVGLLIGYATNWLAIQMLFHPRVKRFGYQGLLPRRQADIARDLGRVIGEELSKSRPLDPIKEIDLREHLSPIVERGLNEKLDQLKSIPLLGS